jgi:hypothetical protein
MPGAKTMGYREIMGGTIFYGTLGSLLERERAALATGCYTEARCIRVEIEKRTDGLRVSTRMSRMLYRFGL